MAEFKNIEQEILKPQKSDKKISEGHQDFNEMERKILRFWEEEKVYEKVRKKNSKGKKFYFLQGPPYTSGKLHIGHAWNNSLKDMILRYKRMNGFDVWDRGGYDMHGLPTENAVQKKLGLKTKEEIEKYGVDKFVKDCMDFSIEHAEYMNQDLWKLGIWMDHKNAYKPVEKEFISGQWALFKKAWEQKRLFKGKRVMHWDAEAETSLAKHELEYKIIKDDSIFLKFQKKGTKNEYFIIWTTTPWTIPFNLAIMVNPELNYVKAKVGSEYWILAKDLAGVFLSGLLGKKLEVVEEFKGKKLEGQEYIHPLYKDLKNIYDKLKKEWKNVHTIILNKEHVDTTAGTGLVHCAPGCGPEDQEAAEPYKIGAFNMLNEKGEFEDMGRFNGMCAKIDDDKFIHEFEKVGSLIVKNKIEHEYPHSWRSHKPVVFRPTEQWFLKTSDLVPMLLKFNESVKWVPDKTGESYVRWAKNLKDNSVTRQRFWGCPVPIWVCECGEIEVIGGVEELSKRSGKKFDNLTLHRPWIDEIYFKCRKCRKNMKRIADVCDVWIDSGTASWNSLYNDPNLIKKYFPADLVLEATEQTRLWFSLLQICSAIMFKKSSYKNVFAHGMILDYQGTKMSKSLGNIISPYEVIDKYSADIFRYYICQISAGENINFNWEDIKVKQRNMIVLTNIANYISDLERQNIPKGKIGVEEKWILSKFNASLKKVSELFENFRLDETIGEIEGLFMALSRDYIKLIRDKASENSAVLEAIKEVYSGILKMFSTITPFVSDYLWLKIGNKESVHLSEWPKFDKKKIDVELDEQFKIAFEIIEKGLSKRDKVQIGLKWPLKKAVIKSQKEIKLTNNMKDIIMRQLNVKNLEFKIGKEVSIDLDTTMTPELESEGYAREFARNVQAVRKKEGLQRGDSIKLKISTNNKIKDMLKQHLAFIKERINAKDMEFVDDIQNRTAEFTIKENKIVLVFCN